MIPGELRNTLLEIRAHHYDVQYTIAGVIARYGRDGVDVTHLHEQAARHSRYCSSLDRAIDTLDEITSLQSTAQKTSRLAAL